MYTKDLLVLYVSKKNSNNNFIENILEKNVKKIFFADSRESAILKYQEFSPCLIIVEDDFNDDSFLKLFKQIRENDIKTAFIVISNSNNNKYLLDLMELYLTKYIIKPYESNVLVEALEKAMQIIQRRVNSNVKLANGVIFNFQTQSIIRGEEVFVLNKKESLLMNLFIKNQDRVISYEEIEYYVWHNQNTKAALKSLVRDFRKKTYKDILVNYSAQGYKLKIYNS